MTAVNDQARFNVRRRRFLQQGLVTTTLLADGSVVRAPTPRRRPTPRASGSIPARASQLTGCDELSDPVDGASELLRRHARPNGLEFVRFHKYLL